MLQGTNKKKPKSLGKVQSVGKAIEILHAFDRQKTTLSLRAIAELTGVPRSTCHALVETLVEGGLLESSGSKGGYQLGPSLVVLSGNVLERTRFQDAVYEVITSQLSNLRIEVHTARFVGTGIVYLQKNGQPQRLENSSGRFYKLLESACGLAVLMGLPRDEILEHIKELPTERQDEVLQRLRAQLSRGYVLTSGSQPGFVALASPIRDADGSVLGAIGTADHKRVMTSRRVTELGSAFRSAALDVSRMLGYLGPKEGPNLSAHEASSNDGTDASKL